MLLIRYLGHHISDDAPLVLASAVGLLVVRGMAEMRHDSGSHGNINRLDEPECKDVRPPWLEDAAAAPRMSPWGVVRKPDSQCCQQVESAPHPSLPAALDPLIPHLTAH